jgi:hypothetical protein
MKYRQLKQNAKDNEETIRPMFINQWSEDHSRSIILIIIA